LTLDNYASKMNKFEKPFIYLIGGDLNSRFTEHIDEKEEEKNK